MDFSLTQEQQMTQKMVRDFAQKEIAPVIKEYDRKQEPIPFMLKRMGELGILGLPFPVRYGGQGMDLHLLGSGLRGTGSGGHPPAGGDVCPYGTVRHDPLPVGNGGAETAVPCAAGKGRKDRVRRLYGARHGIRRGRDDHLRQTGWGFLHPERRKDVDLARLQGGPGAGHR